VRVSHMAQSSKFQKEGQGEFHNSVGNRYAKWVKFRLYFIYQ